MVLNQEVIDFCYVRCPHCKSLVDLSSALGVSVDAFNIPNLTFCSWKCLGAWITDVYQSGKQFGYGMEIEE